MVPVRQSTAFEFPIGPVLDADGVAVTDCTASDFKIKKTTGNFAALNGSATVTHVSAGTYDVVLTTSDTDTVGLLTVAIDDTVNACAPVRMQVVEEAIYDAVYAASATGLFPANVTQIGGDAQSATDLKDFADAGYDPGTNKVQGVVLVDTTTTNSDMRGTDNAATAAEMAKVPKSDSNVTWNATAAAQIQTKATDALNAYDPPTYAELRNLVMVMCRKDASIAVDLASVIDAINTDMGSGAGAYANTTDSKEAQRDNTGTAGAGLTAIDLPDQTMNITGNITGNVTGSVGSVTAGVTLANDAITASKFDESTAFPLTSADSGSTAVARTGADSDTLETLSDEIAAVQADLPQRITKNTALSAFEFTMVDSTDHVTGKTGLTVTATRSLDGAAFASCANSVSEVSAGVYKIDLAAGDLNGNTVTLKFAATGADTRIIHIVTQPT